MSYPKADAVQQCLNCGKPLTQNIWGSRKYCNLACRAKAASDRKNETKAESDLLQIKNSEGELIEV